MTKDPVRKVIPVLISLEPGPGLWRVKTKPCHSQDPGQNKSNDRTLVSQLANLARKWSTRVMRKIYDFKSLFPLLMGQH